MPIISQCPVTESFPFDASAMRPIAAGRRVALTNPPMSTMRSSPRLRSVGTRSGDLPRDVAERVAAFVAVRGSIRKSAGADAVEHDDDDSGKNREHRYTKQEIKRLGELCFEQGLYRCERLMALARSRKPH